MKKQVLLSLSLLTLSLSGCNSLKNNYLNVTGSNDSNIKELARQTLTTTQTKYSVTLSGTDTQLKFMSGNATIYIQEVIIHY